MNRETTNHNYLWLSAIPVLMILLAFWLRASPKPYPAINKDIGTFRSYKAGKRVAMVRLSDELRSHPDGMNFSVRWFIGNRPSAPSDPTVGIGYNRREKKFILFDFNSNTVKRVVPFDFNSNAVKRVVPNVKPETIHKAAVKAESGGQDQAPWANDPLVAQLY